MKEKPNAETGFSSSLCSSNFSLVSVSGGSSGFSCYCSSYYSGSLGCLDEADSCMKAKPDGA